MASTLYFVKLPITQSDAAGTIRDQWINAENILDFMATNDPRVTLVRTLGGKNLKVHLDIEDFCNKLRMVSWVDPGN